MTERLLHTKDLAELLQIGVGTIRNYTSGAPHLLPPYVRIGGVKKGAVRWRLGDVERWLDQRVAHSRASAVSSRNEAGKEMESKSWIIFNGAGEIWGGSKWRQDFSGDWAEFDSEHEAVEAAKRIPGAVEVVCDYGYDYAETVAV